LDPKLELKRDIHLKIISIISFFCILLSYIILYLNPAKGYELSIYKSTPIFVWIFLIISVICGTYIIINLAYYNDTNHSLWFLGFLILIFTRVTLLWIPYIRGYYSWRGDNISHIGYIKDILISGHVLVNNPYPITHIFVTTLIQILGLPTEIIVNYSTALLSVFYVISIYLLSTSVLDSKREQLLSVAAISCVMFNGYDVYLMPNGWSLLYLPIVLYFCNKSFGNEHTFQYTFLLVVLLILYPFFHPLSSCIIILMLFVIGIIKYVRIYENRIVSKDIFTHFPLGLILLEIVIMLPWVLSFQRFKISLRILYQTITTGSGPNAIADMGDKLDKINLHGFETINLILKIMGDEILYLTLTFICFIILIKKSPKIKNTNLMIVLIFIFSIGVVYFIYLVGIIPGLQTLGSSRLTAYLASFTPIPVGFVLNYILCKKKNISGVLCIFIILTASTISISSLYQSPYILRPTPEITKMDINGASWLLDHKNPYIESTSIQNHLYLFANGILGVKNAKIISHYPPIIPDHFNYSIHTYLGSSYQSDEYALITMYDSMIYETVWKVIGRFNSEDFKKLNNDLSVNKLYSNGEDHVYYIHQFYK